MAGVFLGGIGWDGEELGAQECDGGLHVRHLGGLLLGCTTMYVLVVDVQVGRFEQEGAEIEWVGKASDEKRWEESLLIHVIILISLAASSVVSQKNYKAKGFQLTISGHRTKSSSDVLKAASRDSGYVHHLIR